MNEEEMKSLSIKEIRGYLNVYGISSTNLIEKSEFVRLISNYRVSQANVDNYGRNVLPLIKASNQRSSNSGDSKPFNFMKEVFEPFSNSDKAPNSASSHPDLNPLNFIKKVFDGPKDTSPNTENRRASNPFDEFVDGISNIFKPNENESHSQSRSSDANQTPQQSQQNQQYHPQSQPKNQPQSDGQYQNTNMQPPNNQDTPTGNEKMGSQDRFSSSRHNSFSNNLNSGRQSFHRPDIEIATAVHDLPPHEHSFSTPNRPSLSSQNIDVPRPRSRSTDNAPAFEFSPRQSAPYSSSYSPSTGIPTRLAETPTIRSIIANKIDIQSLSTKALRQMLLLERVSLKFALERKDLLERAQLLIDNVRKEQGNLPEDQICKICCDLAINCVLLECGHLIACMECATELQKTTGECPICRARIVRIVHTFKA
ncbi:hypothetical protein HDV01_001137 [Terramyces sp. JEL0728]|nr:hypothetical protein HDV01_001137 [Terramyces sp. JEL0728]